MAGCGDNDQKSTLCQRVLRVSVVVMLMTTIGAPWAFLQTAAWVSMAVQYSMEEGSLVAGLSQTFDGDHPCELCQAALENATTTPDKESDKKVPSVQKIYLILTVRSTFISSPQGERIGFPMEESAAGLAQRPDLPPPRQVG